ncbi:MAG: carboxypeptidase regulatory-like domain-containing protein, partial [Candidatus Harrisonbacteria bacterium]|nr:carboxypeptidase regulatory-like domain-containing protein [Candidatus Harrisonbacteria bacterium]
NAQAKTLTLTLDTATRSENGDTHDFLRFVLTNIKNPSIPKSFDSAGYVLDIKSKNDSGTLLENFSGNPVFITGGTTGGGSATTIRGTVTGNNGNLQGVTVHLMSPQTGPVDATTDASGVYQFSNIPVNTQFLTNNFGGGGEYFLSFDPFIQPTGTTSAFFGDTMPTPVRATSTSIITRDYVLTATSSAINFDVSVTVAASTFGASEQLDAFAGGPGRFVARTVTPGAAAKTRVLLTTVPIPQVNGSWGVGIGPAMPKGGGSGFNGPPPQPTWSMPKPVEVVVSGCPSACQTAISGVATTTYNFSISVADKTIAGILKDGSGNALSGVEVFAFSAAAGLGSRTQTTASGAFSIAVVNGSYVVGAFSPGFGKSAEVPVVVTASGVFVDGSATASTGSSGANPFTLKLAKPSTTITGRVTDGTNAIGNAPVFAYRTDGPGHADAMTDSSTGNYTLYVDNGTWKVGAFIPGFGPATEQTVTVAGTSQSSINFAPSSGTTFSILSGNVYEDTDSGSDFDAGEGITGAIVRLSGTGGTNEGVSGADGAYSVRVPAATGYTIVDVFKPGYGRIAPLKDDGTSIGTINLTASTTQNIKVAKRNTVTINVKDSTGALLTVQKAFIDLFDATTRMGNHIEITNASSTSLQIATGTSATIRAYVQGVPQANISVATDAGAATVVSSSNVLTVDGNETIKITVNTSTAALSTVSGTVYATAATAGNELADAWIQFVDETNGVQFGTQADSSGAYSLKAVDGSYKAIVSKSGYVDTPATVTVSGTTAKNFILSSASLTITGTVTAGSSAATNSFVRAERVGGGQALAKTDTSGAYTLRVTSGTWRVFAAADGYAEGAYAANPVTVSGSVANVNITLATTVSLQSKTATSNTFIDTSAGSLTDTTVGVKVELDSGALGSASSNAYMTAKETSNYPNTVSVNIVGSKAKDISAFSGGSQVTTLSAGKTATVDLTYTVAELSSSGITTSSGVSKLSVVSYSDDKKEWEA